MQHAVHFLLLVTLGEYHYSLCIPECSELGIQQFSWCELFTELKGATETPLDLMLTFLFENIHVPRKEADENK